MVLYTLAVTQSFPLVFLLGSLPTSYMWEIYLNGEEKEVIMLWKIQETKS